jgi:hypothetical protein
MPPWRHLPPPRNICWGDPAPWGAHPDPGVVRLGPRVGKWPYCPRDSPRMCAHNVPWMHLFVWSPRRIAMFCSAERRRPPWPLRYDDCRHGTLARSTDDRRDAAPPAKQTIIVMARRRFIKRAFVAPLQNSRDLLSPDRPEKVNRIFVKSPILRDMLSDIPSSSIVADISSTNQNPAITFFPTLIDLSRSRQ